MARVDRATSAPWAQVARKSFLFFLHFSDVFGDFRMVNHMGFDKKALSVGLLLLLLVPLTSAFVISSITTSSSASRVTTGTDVTITASATGDSSGTATQISFSGSGLTTGSPLTVSDPTAGYYSGVSLSTSASTLTYIISAATTDTYSYSVTGTYSGGSASSESSTIEFINPDTLTVGGTISNSTPSVGNTFIVEVTVTNPSTTQSVTTAYALDYNSTAFTLVSGDSSSGTVTLSASQSQVFSYTFNATASASSSPISFGLGDSSDAYSTTVTSANPDTTAPTVSLSSPALGAGLTSTTQAFTWTFSDSDSSGSASCRLYIDLALVGTAQSVAEGATGSVTATGLAAGSHSWRVNCIDAASNSGNSSDRTFSVSLSSGSGSGSSVVSTATPSSVTTSASAPSLPPAPTTTGSGETVEQTETEQVGMSTVVRGSFASESATLEVAYTAPVSGFSGDLTYSLPLDYADYEAGLVSITPEPKSVTRGSIIATWDVALAPKETFVAMVNVAKKLDAAVLNEFKAPKLTPKSVSAPAATVAATAAPTQAEAPAPAKSDNTLMYIVGALLVLGLLYYFVGMRKK